ncbi:MAG: glycoside hydrolase family 31 protein [Candidatus Methylacidiphilales bacterium]|nr:glycoside hydrolase family 31 protein [Candidatus Methylacidiphilales bacterium]
MISNVDCHELAGLVDFGKETLDPARSVWTLVAPGVWKITLGKPEEITPVSVRCSNSAKQEAYHLLPEWGMQVPFEVEKINFRRHRRGCTLELPYDRSEGIFGLGLQLKSHLQSGKKKQLRVNADPTVDTGDSHAPVPFFVSTHGYGIFVDTARYASFYFGTHAKVEELKRRVDEKWGSNPVPHTSTEELYAAHSIGNTTVIDIPAAAGVDIYFFAGPDMKSAVSRYVLFSGGGFLPPIWGLGNWYRACGTHNARDVLNLVRQFQKDKMPFSVIGLEPGWHTHFYPNSFVWSERFPDPRKFTEDMHERGYRLNLWENAFVHPAAPFAEEIKPFCGDELSTDGLAPDFLDPRAKKIFSDHHDQLIKDGADGFKLDECDNGDFLPFAWSFPEHTQFPSGADGEQMHSLYGVHYQHTLAENFQRLGRRQYDLVRSSGALAAPLPYVLYSDLYGHDDFIRGLVNAGFSGLLWTPEVRHADSIEDLVRRVQCVALSPLSLINGWYIPNPPWKQVERSLNEMNIFMAESEEISGLLRGVLNLRMRLLPYLYTAFATYAREGTPPFRALVMDYPGDRNTWRCDRQFLVGHDLLMAPLLANEKNLDVYLPQGVWRNFFTGKSYQGGEKVHFADVPLSEMLLFVRDGAILPLASPGYAFDGKKPIQVVPHIYSETKAKGCFYDDDGNSLSYLSGECVWHDWRWSSSTGFQKMTRGCKKSGAFQPFVLGEPVQVVS